jgi:hypothetical protein
MTTTATFPFPFFVLLLIVVFADSVTIFSIFSEYYTAAPAPDFLVALTMLIGVVAPPLVVFLSLHHDDPISILGKTSTDPNKSVTFKPTNTVKTFFVDSFC